MNINDYLIEGDLKLLGEETHPYNGEKENLELLKNATILIVGTFPPARFTEKGKKSGLKPSENDVEWFYGSEDNGFWELLTHSLGDLADLKSVGDCIAFTKKHHIALLDLFQEVLRYDNYASDLYILPKQIINLTHCLEKYPKIHHIIFTSEWTESIARNEYRKLKEISSVEKNRFEVANRYVTLHKLPSPSGNNPSQTKKDDWKKVFENIRKK